MVAKVLPWHQLLTMNLHDIDTSWYDIDTSILPNISKDKLAIDEKLLP